MLRNFLTALLLAILATQSSSDAQAGPPNVLLIITDDQGYGDIGFHGNQEIQTPSIDALARSSLRLTNFHVDPTCAETRAALMTGRYPLRGGVWHTIMGRSILRQDAVTMPQLFKAAGYRTGLFGKWHLGDNYPYRPQDRGFDQTLHLGGGGVSQVPDVWGNDYFDDVYWSSDQLTPVQGYCTDVFFNAAGDFINQSSDKPFFCYVATNAPHSPYNVAQSYKQPYLDKGIEQVRASFYGMITNIDDNVGRMLKLLDDRGLAENTIVIFMTDNGTAAGFVPPGPRGGKAKGFNAGMRAQKGSPYDGGHRVPCYIRYARELPINRDFPQMCAHMDLLPTLARLCQLDTSSINKFDGIDLVDHVKESKPWPERSLIVQSHRVEEPQPLRKSVVMRGRWRLVEGKELYDIETDPAQSQPLDADKHVDITKLLLADYDAWWKEMQVDPNQYSYIPLGNENAPRVRLTTHDWHGPQPQSSQEALKKDPATNGFWAVDVQKAGTYQFLLSRRPLAEPTPINATKAKLKIAEIDLQLDVEPTCIQVPVTVRLKEGKTKLETELIGQDGSQRGAYFITVNYLGDVSQATIDQAGKQLPNWLHAGDRVAWLGGTLVDGAFISGALDRELLRRAPLSGLTFVNLGWSGDDFSGRGRAILGSTTSPKTRRLNNVSVSGASVVMIAYGMSELFDESYSADRIDSYEKELRELVDALREQGRRSVICLPPSLSDETGGNRKSAVTSEMREKYIKRRLDLVGMLRIFAHEQQLPVVIFPPVRSNTLESGSQLSPEGYKAWASEVAESLLPGPNGQSPANPRLAQLSSDCGDLFLAMHRIEKECYLRLSGPGQRYKGLEVGQMRALLADKQLELLREVGVLAK